MNCCAPVGDDALVIVIQPAAINSRIEGIRPNLLWSSALQFWEEPVWKPPVPALAKIPKPPPTLPLNIDKTEKIAELKEDTQPAYISGVS